MLWKLVQAVYESRQWDCIAFSSFSDAGRNPICPNRVDRLNRTAVATRVEPSSHTCWWRSGRPLGVAVHGTVSEKGVSGSSWPGETHCPRPLPLDQASHLYQRLFGVAGLDSGKSPSLPYTVMSGISDDLIVQTPLRRAPLAGTIP